MTDGAVGDNNSGGIGKGSDAGATKPARKRGAFPRLSLRATLELPQAMYDQGEGESVRRLKVLGKMGRSADSSSSRALIIAANGGYGLVKGSYAAEFLDLTDRGLRMASPSDDAARHEAAYEALFSNEIFAGFVQRFFQRSVPNQEVAEDYLKKTYGLSARDAQSCFEIIRQNVSDWKLAQEISGKLLIISREIALEDARAVTGLGAQGTATDTEPVVSEVPQKNESVPAAHIASIATRSGEATAEFHFNIQVHLPSDATPDAYDAIFKSIATHLLGRNQG